MTSTIFSHQGKFFFKDATFPEMKYGPYTSNEEAVTAEEEYQKYLKGEIENLTLLKVLD